MAIRQKCVLLCEINKEKRAWAEKVHNVNGAKPFLHEDITKLGSDSAAVRICKDGIDYVVVGLSCKDWAKSNNNRKAFHD